MKSLDTGPSPVVTVKMPSALVEKIDRARARTGQDRSSFIRDLLHMGLAVLPAPREAGAE